MTEINIIQGDITQMKSDAIINAANARMIPGGGVDGAINAVAGPELSEAMLKHGPVATGQATVTKAFKLPAKYVIHAVGPIYVSYSPTKAERLLRSAYRNALELADSLQCKTVHTPLISTGVYGYPLRDAIEASLDECFSMQFSHVTNVAFVAYDLRTFEVLEELWVEAKLR